MNQTQIKTKEPDASWLYGQGWRVREAADHLGVSAAHLSRVLKGMHPESGLGRRILTLPKKTLVLRTRKVRSCQSVKKSPETCSTLS